MARMLTVQAFARLKKIHKLSRQYNGPSKARHLKKLLSLAQKHIDEILLLRKQRKAHYLIETGDLLILCLEILLENKKDISKVMELCFDRYERKLTDLMGARQ